MTGTPRPAFGVEYQIGGATLADGTGIRVINLTAVWRGGFEIEERVNQDDPAQVAYAAAWAVEHRARWYPSGYRVHDPDEVISTFTH